MRASARELLVPFFTVKILHLWYGAAGIRTHDLPLRKRTLYQLSYRGGLGSVNQMCAIDGTYFICMSFDDFAFIFNGKLNKQQTLHFSCFSIYTCSIDFIAWRHFTPRHNFI